MPADVNKNLIRPPLSSTGRFQCPVDDRGESGKSGAGAACISDIKGQRHYSKCHRRYSMNPSLLFQWTQ